METKGRDLNHAHYQVPLSTLQTYVPSRADGVRWLVFLRAVEVRGFVGDP